jgi:Fic family protein
MVRYIWQTDSWPALRWNNEALLKPLGKARQAQGRLMAKSNYFDLKDQVEVLVDDAFTTAAIEGEKLNRDALRSSVARRLGLPTAGLAPIQRNEDGLVEMLIDATRNYEKPLTASRLKGWQASLFPTGYSGIHQIVVGNWRTGDEPMQVVSGPFGREKVHFQAPPAGDVKHNVKEFLAWFRSSRSRLDGLVRSAVAHFWFVTIHPFEDGNGRVSRAIADMILAQDEDSPCRLYSMSAQIRNEQKDYYRILEKTQKGSGDITEWIVWFLKCIDHAIACSENRIRVSVDKARFWEIMADTSLNDRQRKVVNRLLDAGQGGFEGGLTNRKYRGMTKTSRETAKRDIANLVGLGILKKNSGKGRSVSYDLVWSGLSPTA